MDTGKRAVGHRRTLSSLLLAVGALALGLVAQDLFGRRLAAPAPTDGLLAFVGAALLFAVAVLRSPGKKSLFSRPDGTGESAALRASGEEAPEAALRPRRLVWAAVLLALSGVATLVSLALFRDGIRPRLRWLLYLISPVLLMSAVYLLERPALPQKPGGRALASRLRSPELRHVLALVLILLVGIFFRLYRFTELPFGLWYDEADNGLWARRILADPDYRPIYVPSTNLPAHFLYLVALAFRVLGDSMHAIRVVAVVFGVLTVVAAYCCGCELGGPTFGLGLAALLAVSRWDVNWSRIGMHGVTVPFFELWIVAALLRGLRTRRLAPFGWAGVALGLALCFYSPLRVFPFILAGFLVAWGAKWAIRAWHAMPRRSATRLMRHALATWGVPVLLFTLGALIAVAPVVQYALNEPELFWDRAKKVSIWAAPEAKDRPWRAVLESASKHVLMFHYRGDPNGRHNLPSAPMLARLSGVLMVFGLVLCLLKLGDPRSMLLVLWLVIPLSGGIMSTWFESPQSLRSIGVLPAIYVLVLLPMAWFAGEWRHVFPQPGVRRRLALLGLLVLAVIALENGVTYFYVWSRDFSSWAAFNPAETHLAQDINRYKQDYDLRFDPLLTAHLATRYLAPDYETYHPFDPATVFPLRGTDREGVVLFLAPDTHPLRTLAENLYPGVAIETFAHPHSGRVVLHKYVFSQEEIAGTQGVDVRYLSKQVEPGEVQYAIETTIDRVWGDDPPVPYPLAVTWTGGLLAPEYGVYTLHVEAPGEFSLVLDGLPLLSGTGSGSREIVMARGLHPLSLDAQVAGPGAVRLSWQTPQDASSHPVPADLLYRAYWPARGLVGRFYPNADWSGEPALARIDPQIAYYFHFLPMSRPYTVEWRGRLNVPATGAYGFNVQAISGAALYVDDELVFDSLSGQGDRGPLMLSTGLHDIRLRYLDDESHSQVYLYWAPPGAESELVPADALFLPAGGAWWPAP